MLRYLRSGTWAASGTLTWVSDHYAQCPTHLPALLCFPRPARPPGEAPWHFAQVPVSASFGAAAAATERRRGRAVAELPVRSHLAMHTCKAPCTQTDTFITRQLWKAVLTVSVHAVTCASIWRGVPSCCACFFTRGRQEGRGHLGAFGRDVGWQL